MKKYELAVVLDGKTTPAKKKTFTDTVESYVKTLEGKVVGIDDWGKKDLAYPIAGNESGYFLIYTLELSGAAAREIGQKLKLEDQVIRHLLIIAESARVTVENDKKS